METKELPVINEEAEQSQLSSVDNIDQNNKKAANANGQNAESVPTPNRLKYGRVVILLENPILSKETIQKTPSMADGLDPSVENDLRVTGCKFIQISGILLRLPQVAMATGQVLFQRFYYSKSFVRQPMEVSAMACVVLASKVEEAPRRMRDVINVFHNMKQIRLGQPTTPMILDENYVYHKNQVIKAERRILKELGFCVHVKHPHKFIVAVAQILKNESNTQLIQTAWNYMNDSLQTNVFVRFTPEAIACACIHLSSRVLKVPLPTKPLWYELFNVDADSIEAICKSILMLYTVKTMTQEELENIVEEARKLLEAEKMKQKKQQLNSIMENISSPVQIDDSHTNSPANSNQESMATFNKNIELKSIISRLVREKAHRNETKAKSEQQTDNDGPTGKISILETGLNQNDQPTDNHSAISSSSSSHSFKLQKSPLKRYDEDNNDGDEGRKYSERTTGHKKLAIEDDDGVTEDVTNHRNSSYNYYKNGNALHDQDSDDHYSSSNYSKDRRKEAKEYRSKSSRSSPPRSYVSSKVVHKTHDEDYQDRGYDQHHRHRHDYRDSRSRSPLSPYPEYHSSTSRRRKHRNHRDEERISSSSNYDDHRDDRYARGYDRNYETSTKSRSRNDDYYRKRSKSRSPSDHHHYHSLSSSSASSSRHHIYHHGYVSKSSGKY